MHAIRDYWRCRKRTYGNCQVAAPKQKGRLRATSDGEWAPIIKHAIYSFLLCCDILLKVWYIIYTTLSGKTFSVRNITRTLNIRYIPGQSVRFFYLTLFERYYFWEQIIGWKLSGIVFASNSDVYFDDHFDPVLYFVLRSIFDGDAKGGLYSRPES